LLCLQLKAEVGQLAAPALAMLTGTIFACIPRAFWAAPEVAPEPPVYLVFRADAFRHLTISFILSTCLGSPNPDLAGGGTLKIISISAFPRMASEYRGQHYLVN